MKFTLLEVRNKHSELDKMGEKKLPVKMAYAIGKNFLKFDEEMKSIDKARVKLLEQYAEKDDDGNCKRNEDGSYVITDEAKLNEEYREFLQEEVEIDIHTVSESMLDILETGLYDVLTVAELVHLDFMLEKPVEVEPKA